MPSPFPGMDPYFEDPAFWEGFHDIFIAECIYAVEAGLPDGYISDVKEGAQTISADDAAAKVYVPDISVAREPSAAERRALVSAGRSGGGGLAVAEPVVIASADRGVEVRENFIEIYKLPDHELVTAVELLSPWNKNGSGVAEFRNKRLSLLGRGVHVVEVDLLRAGRRAALARPLPAGDYYTMVFRADRRPDVEVYPWGLRDPLPAVPVPLRAPDADVRLDLAAVVSSAYDRGRYDRKLRYRLPVPAPAPTDADAAWAAERLRAAGRG